MILRISSKLLTVSIFFLFSIQNMHNIECVDVNLTITRGARFNSSIVSSLDSFDSVSFSQCIELCCFRPRCLALEYQYLTKYCSLRLEAGLIITAAGHWTVSGFKNETQCREAACDTSGTLQDDISSSSNSNKNNACLVTECGYPDKPGVFKGNRFNVGSELVQGSSVLECNKDGDWVTVGNIYNAGLTCTDIKDSNPVVDTGVYNNSLGIEIYCDFDTNNGGYIVFQRREDGSVDFYRTWADYKAGFGNLTGEFWLGLDNLGTILRNSTYQFELHILLEDWENNTAYADYDLFDIGDEADGYRLHVGNYSGTGGDALEFHNGYMFTTKDRENDIHPSAQCAQLYTGAWWYKNCHKANLNGVYIIDVGGTTSTYAENVIWEPWKGYYYSLRKTAMMIREKLRH